MVNKINHGELFTAYYTVIVGFKMKVKKRLLLRDYRGNVEKENIKKNYKFSIFILI